MNFFLKSDNFCCSVIWKHYCYRNTSACRRTRPLLEFLSRITRKFCYRIMHAENNNFLVRQKRNVVRSALSNFAIEGRMSAGNNCNSLKIFSWNFKIGFLPNIFEIFQFWILLTVHLDITSGRWPTWRTILYILLYNRFISIPYMFRANRCSSSGGQFY